VTSEQTNLLRTAFDAYLLKVNQCGLEPTENVLSYGMDDIDFKRLPFPSREMVQGDLREVTNILNRWHMSLLRWHAWNRVIQPYTKADAWELRMEFLYDLAHHCLLMPSSIRDIFISVATDSMHQVRLASSREYPDYLDGDPKKQGNKPKNLTRHQKERRLANLISIWPNTDDFIASLREINDEAYQSSTSDYRNRNSHTIGPRLDIGITRAVVRSVKRKRPIGDPLVR
jgi:hypothetical protein